MNRLAFLFPGQGSQFVGMGRDLFEKFPRVREIYKHADDVLGFNLSDISFNGPEEKLKQTRVTQPAIFVHSIAVNELMKENGIFPTMTAGHSLGEYSALVAAGAIEFEQALRVVKVRAEQMQNAGEKNPGTMAAVIGLDFDIVRELCDEANSKGIVQPANFNSPGQVVISGSKTGVQAAMEAAKAKGAKKVVELVVSGAFHSPLMQAARDGLASALADASFENSDIPVYSNVSASPATSAKEIRSLLNRQLTSPVRWSESIENMIRDGATEFYEIGPGKVLTGLLKRIDRTVTGMPVGTVDQLEKVKG